MGKFMLIDLTSQASIEFQFFPSEVTTEDGANWEPQNTANGKKPLFYANGEPGKLTVPDLVIDGTMVTPNQSMTESIKKLKSFTLDEKEDRGAPPPLLATWGDEKMRCVLTRMTVTRIFFDSDGKPLRAKVSLDLLEFQDEDGATGVNVGI